MNLASILPPEAVFVQHSARDKKQLIKGLSAHASKLTGLSEREIFSVLMNREQAGCTAVGHGVCIPHGRFPHIDCLHALFAVLDKPIPFGAADGKSVDLVFLLLTPIGENTEHLKALATASRLLRDKDLCRTLRTANDAAVIYDILVSSAANDQKTSH